MRKKPSTMNRVELFVVTDEDLLVGGVGPDGMMIKGAIEHSRADADRAAHDLCESFPDTKFRLYTCTLRLEGEWCHQPSFVSAYREDD